MSLILIFISKFNVEVKCRDEKIVKNKKIAKFQLMYMDLNPYTL